MSTTLTSDQIAAMFMERRPNQAQVWLTVKQTKWLKSVWDREVRASGFERIPTREASGLGWVLNISPNGAGVLASK
jgi:hypothetical protein